METNSYGIIGIEEPRDIVEELKDYYKQEYKKIKEEQKNTNDNYKKNKWRVRLGQIGLNIGFLFTSRPVKVIGGITSNLALGITQKVMKTKNKMYNKEVEERLKKLEADFINLDGDFKQFAIENDVLIEETPELQLVDAKVL